jgi:hypothetical protein
VSFVKIFAAAMPKNHVFARFCASHQSIAVM